MEKIIIVNATGTTSGGGLTILQQFLENLPLYDNTNHYYIFCGTELVNRYNTGNTHIINNIYKHKWIGRLWWDNFGIQKWLMHHSVKPDLIISLQNTGIRYGKKINQMIYYNQSIPFFEYHWNIFNKRERVFWIYKNIYPYFVRKHIYKNTKFIVPANWMKHKAEEKFRINPKNIYSIRSEVFLSVPNNLNKYLDVNSFFYPAAAFKYKNHDVIIEALNIIKKEKPKIYDKIKITFTCNKNELHQYWEEELERIEFIGYQQYERILSLYQSHGTLIFPSYLESFAIPLIEAAHFGNAILAPDLHYARETIEGYEGVVFIQYDNPELWANAMIRVVEGKGERFPQLNAEKNNSWQVFFNLVKASL